MVIEGVQGPPIDSGGAYDYHHRTVEVRMNAQRLADLEQALRADGVAGFITQLGHTVPHSWTDRGLGLFWDYDPADDSSGWGFEDISGLRFL